MDLTADIQLQMIPGLRQQGQRLLVACPANHQAGGAALNHGLSVPVYP